MKEVIESKALKHISSGTIWKLYVVWIVAILSEVIIQYTLYDNLYGFSRTVVLGFAVDKALYASLGVFAASSILSFLLTNHVRVRFFYPDVATPKLKTVTKIVVGSVLLCFGLSGLLNSFLVISSWQSEGGFLTQLIEVLMSVLLSVISLVMVCVSALVGAALLVVLPVLNVKRKLAKARQELIVQERKKAQLISLESENERIFKELDFILTETVLVRTTKVAKVDFNSSQRPQMDKS